MRLQHRRCPGFLPWSPCVAIFNFSFAVLLIPPSAACPFSFCLHLLLFLPRFAILIRFVLLLPPLHFGANPWPARPPTPSCVSLHARFLFVLCDKPRFLFALLVLCPPPTPLVRYTPRFGSEFTFYVCPFFLHNFLAPARVSQQHFPSSTRPPKIRHTPKVPPLENFLPKKTGRRYILHDNIFQLEEQQQQQAQQKCVRFISSGFSFVFQILFTTFTHSHGRERERERENSGKFFCQTKAYFANRGTVIAKAQGC